MHVDFPVPGREIPRMSILLKCRLDVFSMVRLGRGG